MQSATLVNPFRPDVLASLLVDGEAQTEGPLRKPDTLRGNVTKRCPDTSGGWGRNVPKVCSMNPGDLRGLQTADSSLGMAWRPFATSPERADNTEGAGLTPRNDKATAQKSERP